MLDFVIGELSRCRTANEVRRVQVMLANELAPIEVAALAAAMRTGHAGAYGSTERFLSGLESMLGLATQRPQPHVRQVVAPGVLRYAAPGTENEKARRTLVVAFTGAAFRLMLPIAVVLQNLDADRHDLLLLFDRARTQFLGGVPGVADDLPALVAALDRLADFGRYRRLVFLGTSAGGLPALYAAIEARAARGVSVGGSVPDDIPQRVQTRDTDLAPLRAALARSRGGTTELVCVCGERHARDRGNAYWYAANAGAAVVEVPGYADHNVLQGVFEAGNLRAFLARLVDEG